MKTSFKTILCLMICLVLLGSAVPVCAADNQARDISGTELITACEGVMNPVWLFDGDRTRYYPMNGGSYLTLEHLEGIGSLYLIFDLEYGAYQVENNDTGESITWGENNFLHQFIDLEKIFGSCPGSVTLRFREEPPLINELTAFTAGQVPDWVQKWQEAPQGEVDLLLLSAHGDDEQLFMGGVLPYYAGELGYEVQVVYSTAHRNYGNLRAHEMLDGLWVVGVTNYPVFGPFADYFSKSLDITYQGYEYRNISRDQLLEFVVEQLRKYKPVVAVTHDEQGEYGHGMHRACADLLEEAVQIGSDDEKFPQSAEQYGTWDVPKTYLHLYPENPIVMDWDQPLDHFGGMTAFEVTRDLGFPAHESQFSDFAWYMGGYQKASQITEMSPCEYGLFRSTVGEDVEKNDFFENVTTHREAARLEQERIEEEKRLAEEAERREKEAEEAAAEEAARATETQAPQTAQENTGGWTTGEKLILAGASLTAVLAAVLILVWKIRRDS